MTTWQWRVIVTLVKVVLYLGRSSRYAISAEDEILLEEVLEREKNAI